MTDGFEMDGLKLSIVANVVNFCGDSEDELNVDAPPIAIHPSLCNRNDQLGERTTIELSGN
jgi:hypothetical protein